MSDLAERLRELGADGSMHRWGGHFGPRDEVVLVPLALLDEMVAYIEGVPPRRRGPPRTKTGVLANDIVSKLYASPGKFRKADLLAEAGKQTGWDERKRKSLRSAVDNLLRKLRKYPNVFD